ncbi:Predicted transcriptional regulator, contains C-terminal CBS domains [Streptomyces sp. AmelKG-D3]|nr:Predicted transcriptional regulator, contains C-terminal CBS domains [Streptomyces sp. AmelKG-D3]
MRHIRAGDLMTDDVVAVGSATPSAAVAGMFALHGINGVPVAGEDDHVVGMVSASDLLSRSAATVGGIMSSPAVTVYAEQTAAEAARLMARRGCERLPAIDDEERLVGMVPRRDLLGFFLRPDAEVALRIRDGVLAESCAFRPMPCRCTCSTVSWFRRAGCRSRT